VLHHVVQHNERLEKMSSEALRVRVFEMFERKDQLTLAEISSALSQNPVLLFCWK
jgi:hypothetical protein